MSEDKNTALMFPFPNLKKYIPLIALVLILTAVFAITGKKKNPIVIEKGVNQTKLAADLVQKAGIKIYPKSRILNGTLTQSPIPGKKEGEKELTTFIYLWLETSDNLEDVQKFYKKKMPYIITERKSAAGVTATQLSSVASFSKALKEEKSRISFVEIKRQAMTEQERNTFQTELSKLSALVYRTPPQNRRLRELEKLLVKETLVKITLRLIYL